MRRDVCSTRTGVRVGDDLRLHRVWSQAPGGRPPTAMYADATQRACRHEVKIVTGYRGGSDVDLAVERGEVDGRMSSWTAVKSQRAQWL